MTLTRGVLLAGGGPVAAGGVGAGITLGPRRG